MCICAGRGGGKAEQHRFAGTPTHTDANAKPNISADCMPSSVIRSVFIYIFVSSALCATQDADVHKAISFFLSLPFFFFFSLIRETLSALFNKKLFVVYIFRLFLFFLFFPSVWTT